MNMKTEKIVMMDSDEAASIQTVTGWVDRQGRFWGKDENQARWCGATHRKCKTNLMSTLFIALMAIAKNATAKAARRSSLPLSARYGPESR
ncbi:hypothetical protein [Citrobacter portucalensis]|uniref:hypothetical protein n=1 Tax=Citrobacter portucalensis TaxID=1639133 RepID=UPI002B3EE48A|nr:hypothetical protein [Citrobacter portucalensis]MEB2744543.1 hypothetical protein [Citrobacter portucalensis]